MIGSCIPQSISYVPSSSNNFDWYSKNNMDALTFAYFMPRSAEVAQYKLSKKKSKLLVQKFVFANEYSSIRKNDTDCMFDFKPINREKYSLTRPISFTSNALQSKLRRANTDAIGVGFLWFLSSALLSTWANTTFIKRFKDPVLHSFVRFFGAAFFSLFSLISTGQVHSTSEIIQISRNVIKPAFFLWLANYFNSVSLQLSGITLTYAVKACIPVFTVLICSATGQFFPPAIFASLVPICMGVAMASISDLDFNLQGLAAAMISAIAQTLLNLSIKKVRQHSGHTGPQAFMGMSIICTLATLPLMAMSPAVSQAAVALQKLSSLTDTNATTLLWPSLLILITAVAYYLEYLLNFTFVGFVKPVTFSVSDIVRRVAIIATGAVVFHKPLSIMNGVGIAVALGGVLAYSLVEYRLGLTKETNSNEEDNALAVR